MSRTVRERKGRKPYWYPDYTWEYVDGLMTKVKLEGKERKKALNRYHSDKDFHGSAPGWWRQEFHQRFRAKARQEIIKYLKDEEYEVQIRNNPRWPWWD